ncbi:unnamed protein product, partial [Meganyctiphanes norvegica]
VGLVQGLGEVGVQLRVVPQDLDLCWEGSPIDGVFGAHEVAGAVVQVRFRQLVPVRQRSTCNIEHGLAAIQAEDDAVPIIFQLPRYPVFVDVQQSQVWVIEELGGIHVDGGLAATLA